MGTRLNHLGTLNNEFSRYFPEYGSSEVQKNKTDSKSFLCQG